jgi:hypothetical protein
MNLLVFFASISNQLAIVLLSSAFRIAHRLIIFTIGIELPRLCAIGSCFLSIESFFLSGLSWAA